MDQANFIEKAASKISDLGLTMPAIFLLEANKPFAFIGSQALLIAQPTFDLFLPQNFIKNAADLFADPMQLEELILKLEANQSQKSTSRKDGQ